MDIEETVVSEELVCSEGEVTSDSSNAPNQVRPGSQVSDFSQKFERMTLLREGVLFFAVSSQNNGIVFLSVIDLHFEVLSFSQTLNKGSSNNKGKRSLGFQDFLIIREFFSNDNLEVVFGRTIVQLDKANVASFSVSAGLSPPSDSDGFADELLRRGKNDGDIDDIAHKVCGLVFLEEEFWEFEFSRVRVESLFNERKVQLIDFSFEVVLEAVGQS